MNETRKTKALWNKNFTLLWQAHFVSQVGTQLLVVAQVLWIKQAAGLATLIGLTSILWCAGSILSGPLGGSFADHHSRKRILIICDFLAGLGSLLIVLFFILFPGAFAPIFVLVAVVSFVNGIIHSFFNPAVQSAIPDLVPEKRLQQANALKNSTFQVSQLLGQGFGAVIFRFVGAPLLYLIDGATYLFSGVASLFIRLPPRPSEKKHGGLAAGMRHHWQSMKEGIRYLVREPGLNLLILIYCALNFCVAPLLVLLPFFVDQNLKAGSEWYGFLMGGFGIGILIGFAGSGLIRLSPRRRALVWGIALVLMSCIAVSGFFFANVWIVLGLFFTAGICNGFTNIIFMTGFQKRTPESMRGRLFGVVGSIAMALMPIGTAVGSVVNDLWRGHVREILTVSFVLMLAVTVAVFPNKKVREYLSWEEDGGPAKAAGTGN